MICDSFDVVVVPFPFVDSPERKSRPALVLSTAVFNRANRHTVLAMITRAAHTRWPSDHAIIGLSTAGLRHASVVRWKLFTLDNRLIGRHLGSLEPKDRAGCAARLAAVFAIAA
jgi:mRNA-degrading endonuclease toxin of MazEF toxin-antitoxin module